MQCYVGYVRQVHKSKSETGDKDCVYETELLGPIAHSVYDQAFFKSLDTQLNKVNDFYKRKEQEFVRRGCILDKQICALAGVKKLLDQGCIRQDEDGASGRESELGRCNQTGYMFSTDIHSVYDSDHSHVFGVAHISSCCLLRYIVF